MNLNCTAHRPSADVFNPRCVRCGTRLLDQNLSPEQLRARVETVSAEPVFLTGRQRGSWVEVAAEGPEDLYVWWVRPASNVAGYEAIALDNSEPTGEELSRAFLVEMLSAPGDGSTTTVTLPAPSLPARHAKAPRSYRLARLLAWRPSAESREFAAVAVPLVAIEALVVGVVLGWSGMAAVVGAVADLF